MKKYVNDAEFIIVAIVVIMLFIILFASLINFSNRINKLEYQIATQQPSLESLGLMTEWTNCSMQEMEIFVCPPDITFNLSPSDFLICKFIELNKTNCYSTCMEGFGMGVVSTKIPMLHNESVCTQQIVVVKKQESNEPNMYECPSDDACWSAEMR